jgi:hypothetical protein
VPLLRWLDTLHREVSGASHRHSAAAAAAWKENAASRRASAGSAEGPGKKGAIVDYSLGFEASQPFSNSRRAFGDALNRLGNDAATDDALTSSAPFLTI